MTGRAQHPLLALTDEQRREMFPFSWAMDDLRRVLTQHRGGSALQVADHYFHDTGDPAQLRAVLTGIRDAADRVLATLDEPVTAEGRALLGTDQ